MKIIFLDIDGVLNSRKYLKEHCVDTSGKFSLEHEIDIYKVIMLCNWLNKHYDVEICLSSSWRTGWGNTPVSIALNRLFNKHDVFIKYFTPSRVNQPEEIKKMSSTELFNANIMFGRSLEIKAWLEEHRNVTEWCAVDDDDCDMLLAIESKRFVHTSFYSDDGGLMPEHIKQIEKILKE